MVEENIVEQEVKAPPSETLSPEELKKRRQLIIFSTIGVLVIVALIIFVIWALVQPSTDTGKVRDIFIIFMAFESFVIGLSLIILMVQLARLINLLQNEVKPIINSTNETVNTLRGTTVFLSDNLVEPVMKMNEYMAGLQQLLKLIGLGKKKK